MSTAAPQSPTKRRQWKSFGSDQQIVKERLPNPGEGETRSLLKVHYTTRREVFTKRRAQHNSYTPKDAVDENKDLRPLKDPNYDLVRSEVELGVQAVTSMATTSTQTSYFRNVNMAIQAEPMLVDARIQPGSNDKDTKLNAFFNKVVPRVLHHLCMNNEVPIFAEDFAELTVEDTFVGTREESYLREHGNVTHKHIKGQRVTSIDWNQRPGIPRHPTLIVVSTIAPEGVVERTDSLRSVKKNTEPSLCVVWNKDDLMHPYCVLEAPTEVLVMKFNPSRPNIIAGGLINGQVALWDIDRVGDSRKQGVKTRFAAQQHHDPTLIPQMAARVKGHTVGDDGISRLQPYQISRVEQSHKRAVHDLCWLEGLDCGLEGRLTELKDPAAMCTQFATISEDGSMLIWDMRPEHLHPDKKRKMNLQRKTAGDDMWVPMLNRFPLTRPDGSGEVMGLRLFLEGKGPNGISYTMACGSIEGEFCVCNWAPKEEKATNNAQVQFDDNQRKEGRMVKELVQAHAGPVWGIHRHPQLPDYYLTVGDWGVKVWKVGRSQPLFSSASSASDVAATCARWSPTRAGVLFVGTENGSVFVWDLVDRSHEYALRHAVAQEAITCLEFNPRQEKKRGQLSQLLSVGTVNGGFHFYDLPKSLIKGPANETRNMRLFLEREERRVVYFQWRWTELQKEVEKKMQERNEGGAKAEVAATKEEDHEDRKEQRDEEDNEYMLDPDTEAAFRAKVEASLDDA